MTTTASLVAVTPDTLPPLFTRADLDKYDTILFDLDGCVWDQYRFLPCAKETLIALTEMGKRLIFCSNNAVAYHTDMMAYFEKNGFPITFPAHYHRHRSRRCRAPSESAGAADPSAPAAAKENLVPQQLYTSALATAAWCERWFAEQGYDVATDKVMFCGEEGFYREMLGHGFVKENVINVMDVAGTISSITDMVSFAVDPAVKCVVMGFNKAYSYVQSAILVRYLHELHIPLISTNPDMSFSLPGNRILPEFGGFVMQLEATVGIKALVTCGKPSPALYEQMASDAEEYCQAVMAVCDQSADSVGAASLSVRSALKPMEKSRTLMVGDNLSTDIQFGTNVGMDTLLVLSGVTQCAYVRPREGGGGGEGEGPASPTSPQSPASPSAGGVVNKSPSAVHTLMNKFQVVPTYVAPNIGFLIGQ